MHVYFKNVVAKLNGPGDHADDESSDPELDDFMVASFGDGVSWLN